MADVPDQAVKRRVEHIVQCDREFDRAETGCEVPTAGADALNEELPQLDCEILQLSKGQSPQVGRRVDGVEQGAAG